jgi:type I site-specific restriction endonuclease
MEELDLPKYELTLKEVDGKTFVFDIVRKQYVVLTPEERVRQMILAFLIRDKGYPKSLLAVEKKIVLNTLTKRCDIVVYDKEGQAMMIVECKAPNIDITQEAFDQVARYNMKLKVKYLLVTNGLKHFCCLTDFEKNEVRFLKEIPAYNEL